MQHISFELVDGEEKLLFFKVTQRIDWKQHLEGEKREKRV
jgi:hypothetical protein